jgi:gentisate 1,2-dioxygenase
VLQYLTPHARSALDEYTVGTLLCCVQCLLPGETARPHRHSMGAIRLVLEGRGAVTFVNGKPCPMEYGDLILTPAWCWHEHRHDGDEPVLWLDALDVPLHSYLGTVQFERPPIMEMPATVPDAAFQSGNFVPDEVPAATPISPVFRYSYARALDAVAEAPPAEDGSRTIRYTNPLTGGPAQAFMDCALTELDQGRPTLARKSNASVGCVVLSGEGSSQIGDKAFRWAKNDFFTVPAGNFASHVAASEKAHLFMLSNRDVLRRLGLLHDETQTG